MKLCILGIKAYIYIEISVVQHSTSSNKDNIKYLNTAANTNNITIPIKAILPIMIIIIYIDLYSNNNNNYVWWYIFIMMI